MTQTDASRLREARKQCRIVLEDGGAGPMLGADLDGVIMDLDGLIDALETNEVEA